VDRSLSRLDGLEEFLGDLRLLARLEAGALDEGVEAVSVKDLLGDVAREHEAEAETRGLALNVEVEDGIPPVRGHPRLLREAVANYLSNALKFTPGGGDVLIWAKRRHNGGVRVGVTDTGIGIAPRDHSRLFQEMRRLPKRTGDGEREGRASGLGLSIVRRVAEAHDGSVGFASRPGLGSTFWIDLPGDGSASTAESPEPA
jgi:two-component system sensor histidine kinase BaeS